MCSMINAFTITSVGIRNRLCMLLYQLGTMVHKIAKCCNLFVAYDKSTVTYHNIYITAIKQINNYDLFTLYGIMFQLSMTFTVIKFNHTL